MKDFYPMVSIIIPITEDTNKNKKSIKSVLDQTYKNIELIVVCNNQSLLDKIKKCYSEQFAVYNIDNDNIVSLLNFGIEKANGEYVSFLMSDSEYSANKIEREVSTLNLLTDKKTVIYSNYSLFNQCSNTYERISFEHKKIQENCFNILFNDYLNISSFLIPIDCFHKCEVFDSNFNYMYFYLKCLDFIKKYSFYHIEDYLVNVSHNNFLNSDNLDAIKNELLIFVNKAFKYFENNKKFKSINYFDNCCNKELILFKDFLNKSNDCIVGDNLYYPLVSVIIPVYNGSNYIAEAIESVLAQTYKNYEIIVVNDGSTDNGLTESIVKKFGNKIRYFLKKNGGVASALNYGIKKAKGEYISWLSHDDVYYSNKLQKQIEVINELDNKETILFSNFDLINEESKIFAKTRFDEKYDTNKLENSIYPVLKGTTNGCSMLIPKSIFTKSGGFDEDKKTTNDYVMWFKIFDKYPKKFIKDYLIKYRIHSQQDTKVSPVYVEESEAMWTAVFKNIKDNKIKELGYEPAEFFSEYYLQMKESGLEKTSSLVKERYDKCYDEYGPLVTVIMPCYNSSKYLSLAIDSILNQTFMPFELLCIDDGSKDDTYELLLSYQKSDKRIKVFKNSHSKGVSGAMNTGLDNARGMFITRMDSDDISYPNRLKVQYDFLNNNNNYGSCTVNIDFINRDGNITGKALYSMNSAPTEYQYLWTNPIPSAPCMYRKEILNGLRFNELLSTAEDYEFFIQLSKYRIYCFDDIYYSYRLYDESLFHSNYIKTMNNSLQVAKKYYCDITKKKELPEFFISLTDFAIEPIYIENINFNEVQMFIDETLKCFSEYFKWNDEEYSNAKIYSNNILEKIILKKYGLQNVSDNSDEYYKVINSMSWKVTRPLRFASRCFRKIKNDGIKSSISQVIKKVMK